MPTTFGPQLVGETEKTLDAILGRVLAGSGLTTSDWVTLKIAGQVDADSPDALAALVADRAHFGDAEALVDGLTERGLLQDGRLTPAALELVAEIQARITATTAPIWAGFPADDVAATERVLGELVRRGRDVLADFA